MIIGITGGTGCGKTTLLHTIEKAGGLVLDCDAIYHELLRTDMEMLAAIEARFPGTVTDGTLDRKKLGAIVFADKAAMKDLGRITGSSIRAAIMKKLENRPELTAIDAIGLFEGGYNKMCDVTVTVVAPEADRVARLMARDGITEEYALTRIRAQKSPETYASLCDRTLVNDGTLEDFQKKCLAYLKDLGIINL